MADPTTIPNLSAWWEADSLALANGAQVTTLPDLGPNDFDATQATAAQRPTFAAGQVNGLPALLFNGSSQWMTSAAPTAATEQTVVAVLRPVSTAAGVDTFRGGSMQVVLNGRRPQTFRGGVGNIGAANTLLGSTDFSIITFAYNAATGAWSWYLNGAADGNGTQLRTFAATGTAIGRANPAQATEFFSGHLAALITFDRVLTANERAQEHTRLSDKYGITVADYVPAGPPVEPEPAAGERINLVKRPSFEVADLTGWVTRRGATVAPLSLSLQNGGAAAPAPFGAYYGFTDPAEIGDVQIEHEVVPVTAGQPYVGSIHVHRAQSGPVRAFLDWFSGSGAALGSTGGTTVSVTAGGWVRVHAAGVAPTGAVAARVSLLCTDQTGNGVRVDAAMLERGIELLPYFDGSTPGATWDGTPGASYSRFAELLWVGDFETGDFSQFSDFNPNDYAPPNTSTIVTTPVRSGNRAMRVEITGVNAFGDARQERVPDLADFVAGDDLWFGISVQLAAGFPTDPGGFQVLTQWKNAGSGSPPLELTIEDDRWRLTGGFGYPGGARSMAPQDLGPAVPGAYVDWVLHIEFVVGPDAGTVSIWRDGVQVLADFTPPGGTLYPRAGDTPSSYWKAGLYRAATNPTPAVAFYDELRAGHTRRAVELAAEVTVTVTSALQLASTAATDPRHGVTGLSNLVLDQAASSVKAAGPAAAIAALVLDESGVSAKTGGPVSSAAGLTLDGDPASSKDAAGTVTSGLELTAATAVERAADVAATSALTFTATAAARRTADISVTAPLTPSSSTATSSTRVNAPAAVLPLAAAAAAVPAGVVEANAVLGLAAAVAASRTAAAATAPALSLGSAAATSRTGSAAPSSALGVASSTATATVRATEAAAGVQLAGSVTGRKVSSAATAGPLQLEADVASGRERVTRARSALTLGAAAAVDRRSQIDPASQLQLAADSTASRQTSAAADAMLTLDGAISSRKSMIAQASGPLIGAGLVTVGKESAGVSTPQLELGAAARSRKDAAGRPAAALVLVDQALTTRSTTATAAAALSLTAAAVGERAASITGSSGLLLDEEVQSGLGVQVGARSALSLAVATVTAKRTSAGPSPELALAAGAAVDRLSRLRTAAALVLVADLAVIATRSATATVPLRFASLAVAELPPVTFPPLLGEPVIEHLIVVGPPALDEPAVGHVVVGRPSTA